MTGSQFTGAADRRGRALGPDSLRQDEGISVLASLLLVGIPFLGDLLCLFQTL